MLISIGCTNKNKKHCHSNSFEDKHRAPLSLVGSLNCAIRVKLRSPRATSYGTLGAKVPLTNLPAFLTQRDTLAAAPEISSRTAIQENLRYATEYVCLAARITQKYRILNI